MPRSKTHLVILGIFLAFWTSCQQRKQNSVLVIAFEQLSPDEVNCADERPAVESGISMLCKESARFTHAYTSSLQPAAAMASILTGTYPFQNQVMSSGNRLPLEIETLAEIASASERRTAFFSGSPSILRKTGLGRSFDLFDDTIANQFDVHSWSLSQIINSVSKWLFEDPSSSFVTIFFSNYGSTISLSEEDDEQLFLFFNQLKEKKIWETTHIFLVGLRGRNNYSRLEESPLTNLHSENTGVALLYKPPRSKGDEGINWKSDRLVSHVDVGYTISCILKECISLKKFVPPFEQRLNLVTTTKPEPNETEAVIIHSRDPFNPHRNFWALHTKSMNFIDREKPLLFNTVADRSETINLWSTTDRSRFKVYIDLLESMKSIHLPTPGLSIESKTDRIKKIRLLNQRYWNEIGAQAKVLSEVSDSINPLFALTQLNQIESAENFRTCSHLLRASSISHDQVKACIDPLYLSAIRWKHAKSLGLSENQMKLQFELKKKETKGKILLHSKNLASENIWQLFDPELDWNISYRYLQTL